MKRLKRFAKIIRDSRPYRPGHFGYLLHQVYHRQRNVQRNYTDRDHLLAAAEWLALAQDVTGDGGVCGRYSLYRGWSSSYPETTGYILPTFLTLAEELGEQKYRERAEECLEFLLPLQLASGAFPGLEIAMNRTVPSPFNTAQILHGLIAWHRSTRDERALESARCAGNWLLSVQDEDGAFRKYFYLDVATTYSAHAACWLAELGDHTGEEKYLKGAERHLDWSLAQQDTETGWFDYCGFDSEEHLNRLSITHTIAYTLWGVLYTSEVLGRRDGVASVRRAAEGIARRLELSKQLPAVLDHKWKGRAQYVCLTGNVQMALIWMRLHEHEPNLRFLNAALKAIDGVKRAQYMECSNPAIRGGVAGSEPIWAEYIPNTIPNWPAKYLVDALIEKKRTLTRLQECPPQGSWSIPKNAPTTLPEPQSKNSNSDLRVLLYTSPESKKPAKMLRAWDTWGFCPHALVIERPPNTPLSKRIWRRLREDGAGPILRRLVPSSDKSSPVESEVSLPNPINLAQEMSIPVFEVTSLSSPEGQEVVRSLAPDIAVHAGAGILRRPLLEVPRLGTLNAHMGILPYYRGMNVAEWAALIGDPVGCSVYLIDSGIDTGDILCVQKVDAATATNVNALRRLVDEAQIALLGDVLQYVLRSGQLPSRRSQSLAEGVQFFPMHKDLKELLENRLSPPS